MTSSMPMKGDDSVSGGDGIDNIFGGDGDDYLEGGRGDDAMTAARATTSSGRRRLDELIGNEGDDWIEGGLGGDLLNGDIGAPTGQVPLYRGQRRSDRRPGWRRPHAGLQR